MLIINNKSEIGNLILLMKPKAIPYVVGILGQSSLEASLDIVLSLSLKYVIDAPLKGQINLLGKAVLLIGVVVVLVIVLMPFLNYIYTKSIKQVMAEFRKKVFAHVQKLPMSYFENHHSGDIVSRLNNDLQAIDSIYSERFQQLIMNLILGIGSIVFMMLIEWRITLLFVLMGIGIFILNFILAVPIRNLSNVIQKHLGLITERLTDLLAGFFTMKMFKVENLIVGLVDCENNKVTKLALKRAQKKAFLESANYFLVMVNFAGMLAMGAALVYKKLAEFGDLIALIQLQLNVTRSFVGIGSLVPAVQSSLAGAARVYEVLDESIEPVRYEVTGTQFEKSMIGFKDVTFSYNGQKKILNNLSLSLGRGKMAALVGPSGGGKSTLIKLLLGFYPPDKGKITIAEKGLGEYSLKDLRGLIAYVSQDAILYDVSIGENIRYGLAEASENEIVDAAKAANAHEFIMELAEGYNTRVGEGGAILSGGQRQRITIARAILKDAPILLLDEATSALDSENEYLVQQAVQALMKNRTTIVAAHRISTIKNADIIYVIDGGCVVEQGKHDQLISKGGVYSRLHSFGLVNYV